MLKTTQRLKTVEDYLKLPDEGPRYQLVEGELHMAPAPNTFHQVVSRNLQCVIMDFFEDHPIGEIFNAPFDVYLNEHNVFQPDLAVFSKAQGTYVDRRGAILAPWLVIEILSPSTKKLDAGKKREVFARSGSRELWLVDPDQRQVAIYFLTEDENTPARLAGDTEVLTTALFPGLEVSLARVFAR